MVSLWTPPPHAQQTCTAVCPMFAKSSNVCCCRGDWGVGEPGDESQRRSVCVRVCVWGVIRASACVGILHALECMAMACKTTFPCHCGRGMQRREGGSSIMAGLTPQVKSQFVP